MPATEQTWRDLKAVHVIFGVTSVGMLIATIWMLAADHTREWKGYQRKFRDIETWVADARVVEEQTNEYANEHEALVAALSEARATVPEKRQLDEFKKIVQADAERRKATPYDFTEFDKIYASLPELVGAAKEARQASDKAADAGCSARMALRRAFSRFFSAVADIRRICGGGEGLATFAADPPPVHWVAWPSAGNPGSE
jgi:hypothetical protein